MLFIGKGWICQAQNRITSSNKEYMDNEIEVYAIDEELA